jgi:general secretion pathway protein A
MYKEFFGLRAYPFQLNPDPGFLFPSKGHSRAIAFLRYGLFKQEGFIVITGDVGAGKTTLVRSLVGSVNPSEVVVAQIVYTRLEADDMLRAVLAAFNLRHENMTKAGMLQSLEQFFQFQHRARKRVLLIVDEAQNLIADALEELRMLSNFHVDGQPLLQTFLLGQPEFRQIMQRPDFSQLLQRIIASYHLGPIEAAEVQGYIQFRLNRVGWDGSPSFTPDSFDAIFRYTDGVPRRINTLCDRLLLSAFLDQQTEINRTRVDQVARELSEELGFLPLSALPPVPDDEPNPALYEHHAAGSATPVAAGEPSFLDMSLAPEGLTRPAAANEEPAPLPNQYRQSLSRLEQSLEATRRALRGLLYPGKR